MKRRRNGTKRVLFLTENVSLIRDARARKQVTALAHRGYDVTAVCRRDAGNRAFAEALGVRLYEFRVPPEMSGKISFFWEYGVALISSFILCMRAALHGRFDVMQIGNPPDAQFLLTLPFKLAGCRVVVDQRDLSPEVYADRYGKTSGTLYSTLCKLERLGWKTADHVVTVNRSLADTVIERGSKPATAVTIVMNGPPRDRAATARPALKRGRAFLVVWFGAMGPQDHVDLALRAAEHIVKEFGRDDIHFALIGDGESEPALRRLSRELGIDEFVTFTGFLREPEYLEYLATADLGWDTNLQEEVTPVKGMEYLSFGLPMVAFDLRETAAMARDAAEYAPPGDAAGLAKLAVELLDDQPRRARMGAIGRARIRDELAWEHQEERYLAAIDEQAGRSRRWDTR